MNRKLDIERQNIAEKVARESEENHKFKDAEKDKQLADMRTQIEGLKRKAEQGSQQAQGEVLELEFEHLLKEDFPFDEIMPVSKGVKGGDVIQTVKTQSGRAGVRTRHQQELTSRFLKSESCYSTAHTPRPMLWSAARCSSAEEKGTATRRWGICF